MKTTILFTCSSCGAQFAKWTGRCLECGKWSTIEEEIGNKKQEINNKQNYQPAKIHQLSELKSSELKRIETKIFELDRVLGGGIVPGSLILIGGEPGIGKSTLAIQLASAVNNTIYFSGEESLSQIKLRIDRLQVTGSKLQEMRLANETHVDTICATIKQNKPALAIIDSIQTIYSDEVAGEFGSPNQIRACTAKLMEVAKSSDTAIVIIGHVTKDGAVAGPKTLEHLVDTVLYFEGDEHHNLRLLRAVKNRFGSTDEVGIFEMNEHGLQEVKNPSGYLLEERGENIPGSVVTCLMEGTRPLLVEIQALVSKTSFGYPVRKASGFDLNRLHVLTAVLQRRAGLNLAQYDIHLNIVGGVQADEPAADLAVCLAIASAYKDKPLGGDLAAFGEVGLGGEVRSVKQLEKRIRECEQLGLKRVITKLTKNNLAGKIKMIDVKNIQELIKQT